MDITALKPGTATKANFSFVKLYKRWTFNVIILLFRRCSEEGKRVCLSAPYPQIIPSVENKISKNVFAFLCSIFCILCVESLKDFCKSAETACQRIRDYSKTRKTLSPSCGKHFKNIRTIQIIITAFIGQLYECIQ